jgi:prepilin-type N-terminal cleavage/methylation domain-containing protein
MRHHQPGFTLIEIAIVLVIIGLLLGGVLKGQELITQAKIKNLINDLNGVATAVYAYQDRYRHLPGDDPGSTRWPLRTAANSGNGDSVVSGNFSDNAATPTTETQYFWADLRMSGFISGDSSSLAAASAPPTNALGGIVGVQWAGPASAATTTPLGFAAPGLMICSSQLPGKIAESVDAQLDDGKIGSGSVRAFTGSTMPTAAATAAYLDDSTTIYTLCKVL